MNRIYYCVKDKGHMLIMELKNEFSFEKIYENPFKI